MDRIPVFANWEMQKPADNLQNMKGAGEKVGMATWFDDRPRRSSKDTREGGLENELIFRLRFLTFVEVTFKLASTCSFLTGKILSSNTGDKEGCHSTGAPPFRRPNLPAAPRNGLPRFVPLRTPDPGCGNNLFFSSLNCPRGREQQQHDTSSNRNFMFIISLKKTDSIK